MRMTVRHTLQGKIMERIVGRVGIQVGGQIYGDVRLLPYIGQKVFIKVDGKAVYIYRSDRVFLFTMYTDRAIPFGTDHKSLPKDQTDKVVPFPSNLGRGTPNDR
jgi:hypothetical protein